MYVTWETGSVTQVLITVPSIVVMNAVQNSNESNKYRLSCVTVILIEEVSASITFQLLLGVIRWILTGTKSGKDDDSIVRGGQVAGARYISGDVLVDH